MEPLIDEKEITAMRAFFRKRDRFPTTLVLGPGATVTDMDLFIESHFARLQPDVSPLVQRPAWDRLIAARGLIEKMQ